MTWGAAARQAPLSFTIFWSLLKFMSIHTNSLQVSNLRKKWIPNILTWSEASSPLKTHISHQNPLYGHESCAVNQALCSEESQCWLSALLSLSWIFKIIFEKGSHVLILHWGPANDVAPFVLHLTLWESRYSKELWFRSQYFLALLKLEGVTICHALTNEFGFPPSKLVVAFNIHDL